MPEPVLVKLQMLQRTFKSDQFAVLNQLLKPQFVLSINVSVFHPHFSTVTVVIAEPRAFIRNERNVLHVLDENHSLEGLQIIHVLGIIIVFIVDYR